MDDHPLLLLRRDLSSPTGVSFTSGELLSVDVEKLPDHRLELHTFTDADAAAGFVAGLTLTPLNAVAHTWEPGRGIRNRCVIVAFLAEDRPDGEMVADVVTVVDHPRTSHESDDHKASLEEMGAPRAAAAERATARSAPLRFALSSASVRVLNHALNWVTCGGPSGATVTILGDGSFKISAQAHFNRADGDAELIERYVALAEEHNLWLLPEEAMDFADVTVGELDQVADVVRRMDAVVAGMPALAEAFHYARFMAGMRVTPRLRKFLLTGAEHGVHHSYVRTNLRASAGGVELKVGEISRLLHADWLSNGQPRGPHQVHNTRELTVTEAGLAAARSPTS